MYTCPAGSRQEMHKSLLILCPCLFLAAVSIPCQVVARKMMADAGFTAVEMLEWGSELNAYYLAKP